MRTGRLVSALAAAAALGLAAPAGAAPFVEVYSISAQNSGGGPVSFSLNYNTAISFTGQVELSLSLAGVLADGARDGASVTPTGGAIGAASLNGQAVASTGAGLSFAGAGGTAGTVQLGGVSVFDLATPSSFSFLLQQPLAPTSQRTSSQGAVAGALLDGGTDGGTLTGTLSGGTIASFSALSGGSAVPGAYTAGGAPLATGSTFVASNADVFQCSGSDVCDAMRIDTAFQMSGGRDATGLVLRHEIGGDPIGGTVIDDFGIELASAMFDCDAVGGCTLLEMNFAFSVSAGDITALVARIEINQVDEVPEPAAALLFGGALAALGLARRRTRRAPRA